MSDPSGATSDHEPATTAATAPVTVEQAAAILGVSVTTVRRRIRAGALQAEEARRPQGPVWLVYLPAAATGAAEERPPAASMAATTAATPHGQAEAMVSLIQTTIATVLGPLMAEQAAQRQTIERQAGEIAELREDRGRLRERLALTVLPDSPVAGRETAEVPAPTKGAPVQHQVNPGALVPWLFTAMALMSGGRAAVADVSQETLIVGAVIVAVVVVAYVAWKRIGQRGDEERGSRP